MPTPTEIDIDNIEEDIRLRLATKLAAQITDGSIEVEILPETLAAFKRPTKKVGRISICYLDTEYDALKATDVVAQNGFNKFGFFCQSRMRRGAGGVNDLIKLTLKYLIGFRPLNHEKMVAVKVELYQRENDTALWMARVELKAQYLLVEYNDDPAPAKISQMTFSPPSSRYGNDVVVTADTPVSDSPPS